MRDSASAVQKEMLEAYALIEKLGRGVVYYGSARLKSTSAHWDRARALGRDVAKLLGCTTWSGGGPGMMEAATLGTCYAPVMLTGRRRDLCLECSSRLLDSSACKVLQLVSIKIPCGSQVHACRCHGSQRAVDAEMRD